MSFPLSAIASIGGSIVSGLFGQSAAKKAQQREDTSIQRRVADAKAAGIHPLAALGASVNPVTAIPSTGSAVGEGIKELASSIPKESENLQNELLRAQIRNTDAQTSVAAATSRSLIAEAAAKTRGVLDQGPDLSDPLKSQRERSRISTGHGNLQTSKSADAQTAEDRYGNAIEEIWGIKNLFEDYWNSPELPSRKGWNTIMKGLSK